MNNFLVPIMTKDYSKTVEKRKATIERKKTLRDVKKKENKERRVESEKQKILKIDLSDDKKTGGRKPKSKPFEESKEYKEALQKWKQVENDRISKYIKTTKKQEKQKSKLVRNFNEDKRHKLYEKKFNEDVIRDKKKIDEDVIRNKITVFDEDVIRNKIYFVTAVITKYVKYKHTNKKGISSFSKFYEVESNPITKRVDASSKQDARDRFLLSDAIENNEESNYITRYGDVDFKSVVSEDSMTAVAPSDMFMKRCNALNYDTINNCLDFDKKEGKCVIDNFIGVYEPLIKKLNRESFVNEIKAFYTTLSDLDYGEEVMDWEEEDGISPECLEQICNKYDISHYAFDIAGDCFIRNISKNQHYPVLMYYAIDNHQYLIKDKSAIKHLVETTKIRDGKNIISSSMFSNLVEEEVKDMVDYTFYDDVPIKDLINLKPDERTNNFYIVYKNLNDDVLVDIIKYYNIIPDSKKIKASKTNINKIQFSIDGIINYILLQEPNNAEGVDYKLVRDLCRQHKIKFTNQSFVSFIKQYRDIFLNIKHERIFFNNDIRNDIIQQHNNKCASCNIEGVDFDIDHITPLANGGSNEINNLQPLCKACHKQKCRYEQEDGDYVKINPTESSYNNELKSIMESDAAHSWAFVEPIEDKNKTFKKVFHIDINKCRTNILYNSKYNYCVFTVMDEVEKYTGQDKEGIYYIQTNSYFPLRGSGWYYKPVVDYCLENNIINEKNIKYTVQASITIPYNFYNEFIDLCKKELPNNLFKLAINSMIGSFKPNIEKKVYTKSICITRNPSEAYYKYLEYQAKFIDVFDVDGENFYQVFNWGHITKLETEAPLYEQIIQIENIELHKLTNIIKSKGGDILDLSTDCVYCSFPEDKLPFKLATNFDLLGYHWDDKKTITKYKLEVGRNDRLNNGRCENLIRKSTFKPVKNEYSIIEDVDDNNFKPLVKQIIKNELGCFINGPAGTGKSHLIRMLRDKLEDKGNEVLVLAPTNKAALNINGGTIHKFVADRQGTNLEKLIYNYIIIDEISMVKEIFYKFFIGLKQLKPDIKIIIVGDFNQLPPVCDRVENINYKNSAVLYELVDGIKLNLTYCRRSDDIMFIKCKFNNISNILPSEFNNELTNRNIAFTHKKRIEINNYWMNEEVIKLNDTARKGKRKIGSNYIITKKNNFDAHSQDTIIYKGLPVICHVNDKKRGIVNNDQYTVVKVIEDNILISNERETKEIKIKDFIKCFYPAYCITIHSSQGSTYNHPYTIHEWNKLNKHAKYVSLTRSSNLEYINIII